MLELPTYIDNIYIKLLMNKCRYEVGLPRLFKTILVHFLLFCVKISAAEHLYVRWKILYMVLFMFELHTVALTQSMSVHYSQRKNIYFTAKKCIYRLVLVYCYTTLYLINHIWRYLYVLVKPFFDVSSLSHCNLYCWICAYPAIYVTCIN